ncbi:MAG: DNA-directed RNA polymerase subunit alpha [Hormoscilla sp. SP5CHS1]|nr:DNA-directed RNA polymerase subunit alpha [Hormoscilla sp. SP5CHS1]
MTQFKIECVQSYREKDQSQYSRFVLEPLERGQGTTVGNALRRVLLSNLSGSAVTAVRIAGVNHEFATIPGVREDVLDILLNMKEIVLKSYSSQPQIGRLLATGPATVRAGKFDLPADVETVRAGKFDLPADVELVNPSQYIATLSPGATLEMEFRMETGKGYRTVERGHDETTALDFLQIDAMFMPVRKVNYMVESARVEGSLEKDRLIMEITTNGSINPQEALSQAASILLDLFNPLKDITFEPVKDEVSDTGDPTIKITIEELHLSVRAYNCLKRAQINSVSDLLDYTQEDLLEIKNFGQKSAEEVIEALQVRLGITLPHEKETKT